MLGDQEEGMTYGLASPHDDKLRNDNFKQDVHQFLTPLCELPFTEAPEIPNW